MEQRFTFSDTYGSRRGGFFHESILKDNETGMQWKGRVNYVNRTWEPHSFYTSRRCALCEAIQYYENKAVKYSLDQRIKMGLDPIKRVSKEYRRKAIEFYGDTALVLLAGVKC